MRRVRRTFNIVTAGRRRDTAAPTVTTVAVQTGLTVDVTFSEAMGTGVTTAANYTVSGTGKGTLANNPNSVALVSGNKYRCTWSSGEMLNGGNITITVANAQDAAGNAIGSPNSGTHTGGAIGTAPTVAITLSDYTITAGETPTATFTFSEAPTGFTSANVTAPNGALSSFGVTGNPLVYTATFTPTAGVIDTTNVITVDTAWTDAAGNHPVSSTDSSNYTIDTSYTISGTVYDSDGTTAVSGATVALGASSTTSAANGTYSITGLVAGTSGSMTCTKSGYSWTAKTIAAMGGNLTGQNYTNAWWAVGGIGASCRGAYAPKGAASLAASYVNLANPGTDITPVSAPAFDTAIGWSFDGIANYLNTGIVPNLNNDWTFAVEFNNGATTNNKAILSTNVAVSPKMYIDVRSGGGNVWSQNGNTGQNVSPNMTAGNYIVAGTQSYRNGVADGAARTTGGGANTSPVWIGALNNGGTPIWFFFGNVTKVAIYNTVLNSTQAAALDARMDP